MSEAVRSGFRGERSFVEAEIVHPVRGQGCYYLAMKRKGVRVLVVESPRVGSRVRRRLEVLEALFRGEGREVCKVSPERDVRAGEGEPVIVCGGDGTVNRVINSLGGAGSDVLILPGGLFNTLCRTYALPCEPRRLFRAWKTGIAGPIPVGKAGGRLFAGNLSLGFKVDVAVRLRDGNRGTGRAGRRGRTFFSYLAPLAGSWAAYRPVSLKYRVGDSTWEYLETPLLCIAPAAEGGTPFLRVYIVENMGRWRFLLPAVALFFAVPLRTGLRLPGLRCMDTRRVVLLVRDGVVNIDGEPVSLEGELEVTSEWSVERIVGHHPSAPRSYTLLLKNGVRAALRLRRIENRIRTM